MANEENIFTDLMSAVDEAHFLAGRNNRKYSLYQLMHGGICVCRPADCVGRHAMYSTHRDKPAAWQSNQDLTLGMHHRNANRVTIKPETGKMRKNALYLDGDLKRLQREWALS